jgi:hypothetical protein
VNRADADVTLLLVHDANHNASAINSKKGSIWMRAPDVAEKKEGTSKIAQFLKSSVYSPRRFASVNTLAGIVSQILSR